MIVDLVQCEDAHAQERTIMETLLESAQPGDLWIADLNFSMRAILTGWQRRGSTFYRARTRPQSEPQRTGPGSRNRATAP